MGAAGYAIDHELVYIHRTQARDGDALDASTMQPGVAGLMKKASGTFVASSSNSIFDLL